MAPPERSSILKDLADGVMGCLLWGLSVIVTMVIVGTVMFVLWAGLRALEEVVG